MVADGHDGSDIEYFGNGWRHLMPDRKPTTQGPEGIVERLRRRAAHRGFTSDENSVFMVEAADEIERLRKLLEANLGPREYARWVLGRD